MHHSSLICSSQLEKLGHCSQESAGSKSCTRPLCSLTAMHTVSYSLRACEGANDGIFLSQAGQACSWLSSPFKMAAGCAQSS